MPDKKYIHFTALVFLALVVVLPYLNSLNVPFTFDDEVNISRNIHIQNYDLSFSSLVDVARNSPAGNRWLPNISLALNYYFSGERVFSYHLVNIAIHILAAFFLYGIFYLTLLRPRFQMTTAAARQVAFIAALLWGVHPVNTNVVTYIVQRMAGMAALFYFAAIFFYIRFRTTEVKGRARFILIAVSGLMALMAFACKENTFILPFAVIGFELFFLSKAGDRKKLLAAGIGAGLFFAFVSWMILGNHIVNAILSGYKGRDFTLPERLMTEARVIFHYLGILLLPLPQRLNLAYDFPLSTGLLSPPQTILAILGITALAGSVVFLFNRSRLWSFAIFWFLLNLLIESTVIPLELVFEHRLYLSSVFLFLAAVYSFSRLTFNRPAVFRGVILLMVLLLSLFTWQRNKVWSSELSLWEDVARKSPRLARAYVNISKAAAREQKPWRAIEAARKAIALKPDSKEAAEAWLNMGDAYQNMGMNNQAVNAFLKIFTLKVRAKRAEAHSDLAYTYIRMRMWPQAVDEALKATAINPHLPDGWLNLGVARGLMGHYRKSEESLKRGLAGAPRDSRLYMWLAVALDHQGRYQEALAALARAQGLIAPVNENWRKIKQFRREIMIKSSVGKRY